MALFSISVIYIFFVSRPIFEEYKLGIYDKIIAGFHSCLTKK